MNRHQRKSLKKKLGKKLSIDFRQQSLDLDGFMSDWWNLHVARYGPYTTLEELQKTVNWYYLNVPAKPELNAIKPTGKTTRGVGKQRQKRKEYKSRQVRSQTFLFNNRKKWLNDKENKANSSGVSEKQTPTRQTGK